jgi:hypothetical protein
VEEAKNEYDSSLAGGQGKSALQSEISGISDLFMGVEPKTAEVDLLTKVDTEFEC